MKTNKSELMVVPKEIDLFPHTIKLYTDVMLLSPVEIVSTPLINAITHIDIFDKGDL